MTHVPETGTGKMELIFGAGFWSVCPGITGYIGPPTLTIGR